MKILLLIMLCGAILLNGCYSYAVLESGGKEQQLPSDNENVRITLKDGSVIESKSLHHVEVNTPSNFIYGIGISWIKQFFDNERRYAGGSYIGRIDASLIDSSKATDNNDVRYRTFWLKDSSRILFNEGDYVIVTLDQGTGLWCMGRKSNGTTDSLFAGKVDISDVQAIEVKKFSVLNTIGLVLASVILPLFAVGIIIGITSSN